MNTIAVTGCTGYLGGFVIRQLLRSGKRVRALVRQRTDLPDSLLNEDVFWLEGDMNRRESLAELVQGCGGIVHLAFSHVPGKYRGGEGDDPATFWNSNFGTTIALIETARLLGVERMVLLSSRAVFDGVNLTHGLIEDETTPIPTTHYGLLKYATEGLAKLYDDLVLCTLRPTGVYGIVHPVEHTKWWNLVRSISLTKGTEEHLCDLGRTEVHGDDVASAIELLLTRSSEDVHGRSFNCSDIVVSEQFLSEVIHNLKNDQDSALNNVAYPEPPPNLMYSKGLENLGWRAGGLSKLIQTLSRLYSMVTANSAS